MNELDAAQSALASGKGAAVVAFAHKNISAFVPAAAVVAAGIIVMSMTKPRTNREFILAMICVVIGAVFGPSAVIVFAGINFDHVSAMDQGYVRNLLTFVCGLPGWVIVRACFNWSEVNRTKTIVDLIKQLKNLWKS